MKVLLIHNHYKQPGGEDTVFELESAMLSGFGQEVEQIVYHNSIINTFLEKCAFGLRAIYNPGSARALRTKIEAFHPDVIHVHNFVPLASPAVFLEAHRSGIPIVLTLHNFRLLCPSATLFYKGHIYERSLQSIFLLDAIRKKVYRDSGIQTAILATMRLVHHFLGTWKHKIDGYIPLTQFARLKFEDSILRIPSEKLFVKPNFVKDLGVGNSDREDFFLFVGRLTEEKGIRVLIDAAQTSGFNLTIIGDGPLKNLVEGAAQQHSNICYIGFQSKAVIINYLKRCKALIFPSIWYEGFPITIAEAFSTGTPVIASNLGSMKEIVQDRVNGLYFEPGNSRDLAAKLIEINESDELSRQLSENGRTTYLQHYTPEKNYAMLMKIYNKVIELKRK